MSDKTYNLTFTVDIVDDGEGEVIYSIHREEKRRYRKNPTVLVIAKGAVETVDEAMTACSEALHLHLETVDKAEPGGVG